MSAKVLYWKGGGGGKGKGGEKSMGGARRNTRRDSSYNDTANALIKASKESAIIGATGRDIGI